MKRKVKGKKEVHLGLDIGTRLIKAVEVSIEDEIQKLVKFYSVEVSPPLTNENRDKAIIRILEVLQPSTKEVNISLSAPSAIVRFITMPKMKEEDLRNSLSFEAEKYIPFNVNEVIIDASILSQEAEEKNQMKVLLAAAKKGAISSRLEILKRLGYTVAIIDIDSFACFNAFCNVSESIDESESAALLNIGYTQTNVIISKGRQPFFTRDIQIGARDIARAISETMQIDEAGCDKLIFDPKDKAGEVFEVAKSVLNHLVDELRLSFGYYENQYGASVNKIYISGGVARLKGILEFLEENAGIKPIPWNPFSKFEIDPKLNTKLLEAVRPQFAVSAGLAIRS